MSSGTSQQFCVRWNSHLGSLGAAFPQLLAGQRFVDVTLACEGHQLHCHRLVLAACSTYFESLLGENPCKHPIIILPRDIRLWEIQALVDFMYKGEVNVSQAGLSDLLKCAEILQIRGLCGSDAALNLNQVNSAATSSQATTSPTAISSLSSTVPSNAVTPVLSSSVASISQQPSDSPHSLTTSQTSTPLNVDCDRLLQNASSPVNSSAVTKNANDTTSKSSSSGASTKRQAAGRNENSSLLLKTSKNEKSSGSDQQQNETRYRTPTPNRLVGKVEPVDISLDEDMEDQDLSQSNEKISEGSDSYAAKYVDYLEGAKNEFPLANVICEYDSGGLPVNADNIQGRRIRRSETLLRQAAECVSRGQTFQTVSDMFGIPISTIRFFMARKGILPRRKRGRSAVITLTPSTTPTTPQQLSTASTTSSLTTSSNNDNMLNNRTTTECTSHSRSASPSEPPFHFATYKLPELKPKLL